MTIKKIVINGITYYRLVSRKNKNLGTYLTRKGALDREREVNYFKYRDKKQQ
jgi:hypothetical protein